MHPFILILIAVCINCASQLLLKVAMNRIAGLQFSLATLWPTALQLGLNPYFIGGLFGYFLSMLVWLGVLAKMEVSVAYPMVSLGYVITAAAGYYFFNEAVTPMRVLGIVIIIFGVYLVSRTA